MTPDPPARGPATGHVSPRVAAQASDTLQRGASVGRYLVLDKLGEGGMGLVYAAYDPELNRKIALKLLRPAHRVSTSPAQARLLREAQAMARVSHANVISVFDVGTHGDQQVFVAMEFVDGGTLNDWLLKQKRSVREILKLFIEAGRGLAAAHAAGLVHRDFKPENVLLGTDGRVRVTDFGLARLTTDEPASTPAPEESQKAALEIRLTQAGAIVGTPLFMSPEQHRRLTPDARSDQFNFCASLYWAIYGSSPLQGLERIYLRRRQQQDDDHTSTIDTVTAAKEEEGPTLVKEFPREPRLPAPVRRALVRGLALDPDKRFPSMEELLKQLSYDPRVAQRRTVIGAGAALAVALGVTGYQVVGNRHSQLCQGAERKLETVWNPGLQEQMAKSFQDSKVPYAEKLLPQVVSALDAYGKAWVTMHTEACEATRLRGEQTEHVLSLRMICLDRRIVQLGALTRILAAADAKVVDRSLDATLQLPGLSGCADVEALTSPIPLPEDQATRAKVDKIERILAESKALGDSGDLVRSLEEAQAAVKELSEVRYAPIRAEVLSHAGWAMVRRGEVKKARSVLEEAVAAAEEGRLDVEKARAMARLVYLCGYLEGRYEDAILWKRLAEAVLNRTSSPEVQCDLYNFWGNALLRQGRSAEAAVALERGTSIAEQEFGELDVRTNVILSNWASALQGNRDPRSALKLITRSIASFEKTRGPEHPTVANQRRVLATVYLDLKKYANAYEELQKAIEIHSKALGPDNPDVANDLDWLVLTLQADGLYADALQEAERSLQIREKRMAPTAMDLAYSLENIGTSFLGLHRPADAIPNLERAIVIRERNGHEASETAEARFALARALWDAGRDKKRAAALAEQARVGYQAARDQEHLRAVIDWQRAHPAGAPARSGSRR